MITEGVKKKEGKWRKRKGQRERKNTPLKKTFGKKNVKSFWFPFYAHPSIRKEASFNTHTHSKIKTKIKKRSYPPAAYLILDRRLEKGLQKVIPSPERALHPREILPAHPSIIPDEKQPPPVPSRVWGRGCIDRHKERASHSEPFSRDPSSSVVRRPSSRWVVRADSGRAITGKGRGTVVVTETGCWCDFDKRRWREERMKTRTRWKEKSMDAE